MVCERGERGVGVRGERESGCERREWCVSGEREWV